MIRIFALLLVSILCSCEVDAPIKCISILDFGGQPNDNKSDQEAFNAVSVYINAREGNVRPIPPAGNYLVGPQYNYNASVKEILRGRFWDVIKLANVTNVSIEGVGNVQIKFLDEIPVGTVPKLPKKYG